MWNDRPRMMPVLNMLAILLAAVILFGCSSSMGYCRKMQQGSPLPISLEACEKCYERYGEMDREILIGCAIGQDVVEMVGE